MEDKLIPIGKAAELLGVSLDTLRRWDKDGSFPSIKSPGGHRYYSRVQIELHRKDIFALAKRWVSADVPVSPPDDFYCSSQAAFLSRLTKMEKVISLDVPVIPWFSLIVAATGEIGNNSFDHNIGNWPDVIGIFYAYDPRKREVVLADRGRGILKTLLRVKPTLKTNADALLTAFTEVISGRAPEARGNGLKYVKSITDQYPMSLRFQSGNAEVTLLPGKEMQIHEVDYSVPGCLIGLTY